MDVLVRPARDRSDYEACVRLQREVWGLSDLEITSVIQLIATVHAGGHLLVADSAEGIQGFCYAFAALRGVEGHLHSDMLAVSPRARGLGVGLRLKWAQREEALRRGLRLVTWTFDPMRARNARLNLHHLGGLSRELLPDFYGTTSSALHHGLATDRLMVRWELDHPRVARRAAGEAESPREPATLPALVEVAWPERPSRPLAPSPDLDGTGRSASRFPPTGTRCAPRARGSRRSGSRPCARRSSRPSPAATRPRASYRGKGSRVRGAATSSRGTCLRDSDPGRQPGQRPPYSSPVAAGSEGSDDHSLHEPA